MSWLRSPPLPSGRRSTRCSIPRSGRRRRAGRAGPRTANDSHMARGGHAARSRRDLLLPALHAVQARIGWISQPALGYICRRLTVPPAEAYGVATFYALFATSQRPPDVAHVCDDIACRLAGAEETCATLERPARAGRARPPATAPSPGSAAPASASANAPRRRSSRSPGSGRARSRPRPVDALGVINRLDDARAGFADEDATPMPGSNPDLQRDRPAGGRRRPARRPAAARPHRPGRPDEPRRLPRLRRLRGPRPGPGDGSREGRRGGHRGPPPRSGRRRVPDRPQVGGRGRASRPSRTTSSATPTSRSPARSRTGCSWSTTRSRSSRA